MLTKRRVEWNREKKRRRKRLLGGLAHGRKKRREMQRHNREKQSPEVGKQEPGSNRPAREEYAYQVDGAELPRGIMVTCGRRATPG